MNENKKSDAQPLSHLFPPRTLQIGEKSYNTSQAAKIIGVDRKTVDYWRKKGLFIEDGISHTGTFLYSKERVEQLAAVYHKNWIYGGHGEVISAKDLSHPLPLQLRYQLNIKRRVKSKSKKFPPRRLRLLIVFRPTTSKHTT